MENEENEQQDLSVVYNQLNKKDIGFRPKKLTISRDLQTQACDICAVGFESTFQQQERGMTIISCYGCQLSCHLYCYGISTEIELNSNSNNQGYFACDKCKYSQKQDQICIICNQKGGLKKRVNDTNEFVHPLCGLLSKQLQLTSFMDMKFSKPSNIIQIPKQICSFCKLNGATIKCQQQECNTYAHIYCIVNYIVSFGGYNLTYSENQQRSTGWDIQFKYKQLFSPSSVIQAGNDKTQLKTKSKSILQQFMEIQKVEMQINVDHLYELYQQQEKIEEEKDQLIEFYCASHQNQQIYCCCQSQQANDSEEMIQCETCMEWYHDKCLRQYQDDYEVQKNKDNYYCPFCNQWITNKFNHILKYQPVNNLQSLLPPFLKVTFNTIILLGIYSERSLTAQISSYSESEYSIIENILGNLPLYQPLQQLLSQINQKSNIKDFMNFLFKQQIPYKDNNQWIILSQLDQSNQIIQQNIIYNNALKDKLKEVINLFKDFDECNFYIEQLNKLNNLQSAFQIIISRSKVTKKEIQNQFKQTEFQEFKYLQSQVQEYKRIKKIFLSMMQEAEDKFCDFEQIMNEDEQDSSADEDNVEDELEDYQKLQNYLGYQITEIKNYQQFYSLTSETKIKLNQIKIDKEFVEKTIENINQLLIQVPWVELLRQELQQGYNIVQQLENAKSNQDIQVLLMKLEEQPFYYKDFSKFYELVSKYQLYERYMEDLEIQEKDEDDSEIQETKDIKTKITLDHLQMLKQLSIEINASEKDQQILDQAEKQLNEFRQKLRSMIDQKNLNEQMRKRFQAELQMNKTYDVPEIKELQKRLDQFQEVEKIRMAKSQTFQQLEQAYEKSKELYFDEKIINQFEQEINKCLQKKKEIKVLLENEIFETDQLDQAKLLLQDISQSKLIYEEKQLLQSLNKACQFIQQLYEFYQKYKSPDQEMEIEDDKNPDLQFKINQVCNPFQILFKDENDTIIIELDTILSKQSIILDKRINNVLNNYQHFLWEKQAKLLLQQWQSNQEIQLSLIEQVISKTFILEESEQTKLNLFLEMFSNQQKILNALGSQIGNYLFQVPSLQILDGWFYHYCQITLIIKGGIWDQVKIYNVWVTIIKKYFEITTTPEFTYESLKLLQDVIIMSHIPKQALICVSLIQKLASFNSLVEKIKDYNNRKQMFLEKKRSKQDLQKQKQCFTIVEARLLDQEIISINMAHDFISKEFYQDFYNFNQIEEEFSKCSSEDISALTSLYQKLLQSFIQDQQLMDDLKIKIYLLKLKEISIGNKTVELFKAKKQYNSLMLLLQSHNLSPPDYIIELNNLLNIAEKLQNIVNKIKNNQSYTFEELEESLIHIDKIKNINVERQLDLEIKYQECLQIQSEIKEISQSQIKTKEIVVQNILEKLHNLPLPEEKKLVQSWLNSFEQLKQSHAILRQNLSKQKTNTTGKELTDLMNDFQRKYKEIIIIYPDADHLIREYQEFNKKLEFIENNLQTEQAFNDFHDLLSIFRWGEQYERVKIAIWIKQVNQFKDNQQKKWGFASFRSMLNQGYDIIDQALINNQKQSIEKMKTPLVYLEQIMTKLIDSVASGSSLDSYFDGKVDASQLQIELQHITQHDKLERLRELQPKKPFDDINTYFDRKQRQQQMRKKNIQREEKDNVESKIENLSVRKIKKQQTNETVPNQLRDTKKKELLQAVLRNPTLLTLKNTAFFENRIKIFENQEFGTFNTNKQMYLERMTALISTFKELQQLPNFSKKIVEKGFNIEQINYAVKKYESKTLLQMEDKLLQRPNISSQQSDYNPLAPNKNKIVAVQSVNQKNVQTIPKQVQLNSTNTKQSNEDFLNQILNDSYSNNKTQQQTQQQQKPIQQQPTSQFLKPQQLQSQQILQQQQNQQQQSNYDSFYQEQNKQISQFQSSQSLQSQNQQQYSQKSLPSPNISISKVVNEFISSELKEQEIEKKPILYNPDDEEPEQKVIQKIEVTPLYFGDKILKIGKRYKFNLKEQQLTCEFYTNAMDNKLKEFPKISSEFKHQKHQSQDAALIQMERSAIKNSQIILTGWVIPEKFNDLGDIHKASEILKKDQQFISYSLGDSFCTVIYFMHYDQLQNSQLFTNFKLQEFVSESHYQKKDSGIIKFWGNLTSKLCFVITIKQQSAATMLSSFTPLQYDTVRNIAKSKEFSKWVESKISEQKPIKKQQFEQPQTVHKQQEKMQTELEPVTSDEEENNGNQVVSSNFFGGLNGDENGYESLVAFLQQDQQVMGELFKNNNK